MWRWVETLLEIEVAVLLAIVALAAPIVLVLMARDALNTYQRNRR
jgi:hypothetical protein